MANFDFDEIWCVKGKISLTFFHVGTRVTVDFALVQDAGEVQEAREVQDAGEVQEAREGEYLIFV